MSFQAGGQSAYSVVGCNQAEADERHRQRTLT